MALVDCAPFQWPYSAGVHPPSNTGVSTTVNATGEGSGVVGYLPETGTIDKVSFYLENVTNLNPLTQITVSLYTVDTTTGLPTTTLLSATNGQWDKTGSGIITANAWNEFDFTGGDGNGAATGLTKGTPFAAVFEMTNRAGADSVEVEIQFIQNMGRPQVPYVVTDTGSGWAKNTLNSPNVILEYSGATFHPAPELTGYETVNVNSSLERGNRFQVPFPCRIAGVYLPAHRPDFSNTTSQYHLMLDATAPGGARLASSMALEDDIGAGITGYQNTPYIRFGTPYEAAKDTWYRVVHTPAGGASLTNNGKSASNAALKQWLGTTSFYYTIDDGASGWTNSTDTAGGIFLVIDQVDDGSGGGGGTTFIPRKQILPI